jgi:hypothetical protein
MKQPIYKTCPICKGKGYIKCTNYSYPVSTNGSYPYCNLHCNNCGGTGAIETEYFIYKEEPKGRIVWKADTNIK